MILLLGKSCQSSPCSLLHHLQSRQRAGLCIVGVLEPLTRPQQSACQGPGWGPLRLLECTQKVNEEMSSGRQKLCPPNFKMRAGCPLWLPDQKGPTGSCRGQCAGAVTTGWGPGTQDLESPAAPLFASKQRTQPQQSPEPPLTPDIAFIQWGSNQKEEIFLTTFQLLGSYCNEIIKA